MNWRSVIALSLLALILLQSLITVIELRASAKCINVYFLAYDSKSHSGSVVPARICLYPSSNLTIEILGARYGPSVIDSFLLALSTAARICNPELWHLRVVIEFPGNLQIEGASGSLLLTLAVLELTNSSRVVGIRSATGVLSIDGFVDPVGAVKYKLEAASSKGIKEVVVPLLNYGQARNATSHGVHVLYIDTILDVCKKLAVSNPSASSVNVSTAVLKKVYSVLEHDVERFLSLANESLSKLPTSVRARLSPEVSKYLKVITSLLREGHVYSAASQSFALYLYVMNATLTYSNYTYITKLASEALNIVNDVYDELEESRTISVNAIPFVLVVLNRVKDAVYFVNVFRNLTASMPMSIVPKNRIASLVSYAYGRSLTAQTWLRMLELANSSGGPYVDAKLVLDASWRVLDLVSNAIELWRKYAPLSLDTIASTRGYLSSLYNESIENRVLSDLRKLLSINLAELNPIQRIVPYLYVVYANDLRRYRNISVSTQITFYSLADLVASSTIEVEHLLNATQHGASLQWVAPRNLVAYVLYASSSVALIASLAMLALLEVVEKRSRTSRSYTTLAS